jgi:hypothetical protein
MLDRPHLHTGAAHPRARRARAARPVKLRIKGDSLRLRLTRGEVQQLAQQGCVEERVHISAQGVLVYRIRRVPAQAALRRDLRRWRD